jgi:hypothetical protein
MSLFTRTTRTTLKTATRVGVSFRSATAVAPFRSFNTTAIRKDEANKEDSIHVVGYEKGQRVETDIEVDESKPVIPAVQDVEIKAVPLKSRVYETLTPTLKKFCLPGKVAVVTG